MPTIEEERFHLTEEHFFAVTTSVHLRINSCVNAYQTDSGPSPWNLLFIRVGSAPLGEALVASDRLIRRSVIPVAVVVRQEKIEPLAHSLNAWGCVATETTTAMVLDMRRLLIYPRLSDQGVIRLTDNLDDWATPIVSAFGISSEAAVHYQTQHKRALDKGECLYHFIMSLDGNSVCSLTLTLHNGLARLNDVGTDPAHRGKGYSTRLICAALVHATDLGARWCFLESSEQARSLYHRLGFKVLFHYQSFIRASCYLPASGRISSGEENPIE